MKLKKRFAFFIRGYFAFLLYLQLFRLLTFHSFYNEKYYFNNVRIARLERTSKELLESGIKGGFRLDRTYRASGYPSRGRITETQARKMVSFMKSMRIKSCLVENGRVTWGWYNPATRRWHEYRYHSRPNTDADVKDARKWSPVFNGNWTKCIW